jgi:hypothetical protein
MIIVCAKREIHRNEDREQGIESFHGESQDEFVTAHLRAFAAIPSEFSD